eukprot:1193710-Prorocentrum_minimum.AAC.1
MDHLYQRFSREYIQMNVPFSTDRRPSDIYMRVCPLGHTHPDTQYTCSPAMDTSWVPDPARYSTQSLAPGIPEYQCCW